MDTRAVFHTESDFQVGFDPDIDAVYMVWRGYHTSVQFRQRNRAVLDVLERHRAPSILCDIRYFVLIGGDDQVWLNETWLPRAIASGLRTCAMVAPVFYFNQVAVNSVTKRLDPGVVRVEYFDSVEAARHWLVARR